MIPDSVDATPADIFSLADDFLTAARLYPKDKQQLIHGPCLMMSYHACELYLKAHLRYKGQTAKTLRDYGHDLAQMLRSARELGLECAPDIGSRVGNATIRNEYVRVRYLVSKHDYALRPKTAISLAQDLREVIRLALDLNKNGHPNGSIWAENAPSDYPDPEKKLPMKQAGKAR